MRAITLLLTMSLLLTHGSGCSRMLVRELDNRAAWKEDIGEHVVVYTKSREYVQGTLVEIGETEITLDREGVRTIIPLDTIHQIAVHGGIDKEQTVFAGITISLFVWLLVALVSIASGFSGLS